MTLCLIDIMGAPGLFKLLQINNGQNLSNKGISIDQTISRVATYYLSCNMCGIKF